MAVVKHKSEITTNEIKNELLKHYRFNKGFQYISTECCERDVLVSNGKDLIEIEVKVSWADYKRDFEKERYKRAKEKGLLIPEMPYKGTPNYKYYAAPRELALKIKEDIEQNHPHFGVISVSTGFCEFIKRGKRVHDDPISEKNKDLIVARMASELITMRCKHRV